MSNQSLARFDDAVDGMQSRKRKNGNLVRRAYYSLQLCSQVNIDIIVPLLCEEQFSLGSF